MKRWGNARQGEHPSGFSSHLQFHDLLLDLHAVSDKSIGMDAVHLKLWDARLNQSNEGPALIEIMLDRFDTSEALKRLCAELSPDKERQAAKVWQSERRAKLSQSARNRA